MLRFLSGVIVALSLVERGGASLGDDVATFFGRATKPPPVPQPPPRKLRPCELQVRRMKRPPHKREPCAPLPRCDYAGKTLTFTPSSGLGNALLSVRLLCAAT